MRLDRHTHPLELPLNLLKGYHPYTHGGGFGIATEVFADSSLADVLQTLEPNRFEMCNHILDQHKRVLNAASARKITLAMENSPVIAALAQMKFGPIPLELDLWLDPQEPKSLEKAIVEHGSVAAMVFGRFSCMRSFFLKGAPSVSLWVDIYREALCRFSALDGDTIEKIPPLCLDIKSPWSTACDINLFVESLKNDWHIDVCYVGSFSYRQIAEVSGPEKILFCHAVWDLKENVRSGYFPQALMLNGADLEEEANLDTLREIAAEHQLKIGIYVQEPEAETAAIQRLINMVNADPVLFKLGFALGNSCDGKASRMIKGSGAGAQKLLLTNSILIKIEQIAARALHLTASFFGFR